MPQFALFTAIKVFVLGLIATAIAGCATYDTGGEMAESYTITGNLAYRERIALQPGGTARVTLSDISRADAPATVLAEQTIALGNQQIPIPFSLTADADDFQSGRRYAVRGTISSADGQLLWTTDTVHPYDPALGSTDLGTLMMVSVRSSAGSTESVFEGEWRVTIVGGAATVAENPPTIVFTDEGIAGSTGCNRYTGPFSHDGGMIEVGTLAMTRRACIPPLGVQESQFTRILSDAERFEVTGAGQLRLIAASGDSILAERVAAPDLSGSWQVEDIGGAGIIDNSMVTIEFADGQVSGSAGCNRFTGPVEIDGMAISFGMMAMTQRACAEALMNQESRFAQLLGEVDRYEIDETGALLLMTADGTSILARRQ